MKKKPSLAFDDIVDAIFDIFPDFTMLEPPFRLSAKKIRKLSDLFEAIHNCSISEAAKLPMHIKASLVAFFGSVVLCPKPEETLDEIEELPMTLYFYFLNDGRVLLETSGHCDKICLSPAAQNCQSWAQGMNELGDLLKEHGSAKLKKTVRVL